MKKIAGFTLMEIFNIFISLFIIIGWIWNIIKIVEYNFNDPITAMIVLRLVGVIIFPLGAIVGYIP